MRLILASLMLVSMTGLVRAATPAAGPRMAALDQYRHDLVSVLALRADAPHLLGAALLAGSFGGSTPGLDFTSLLARAARADPDNLAVLWTQLGDCDRSAQDCPNGNALNQLKQRAPDNAAVWILALDAAARDNDRDAQVANLRKAAAARDYNDYGGAILKALTLAATALPVPDEAVKAYVGASSSTAGPASAQVFLAYGQVTTRLQPGFLPVMALCDPKRNDDAGQLLGDCRKLGHVLAWGSSPQARAAGLHLQDILASSKEARSQAKADMRDLVWQLRNYSRLALKALADQDLALEMLRLGQTGGSELSRINALLQRQGISTRAPAGSDDTSSLPGAPEPATSSAAPAGPSSAAAPAMPASSTTPARAASTGDSAASDTPVAAASSAATTAIPASPASNPDPATSLATPAGSASITPPAPASGSSVPAPANPASSAQAGSRGW